eukprot:TRINITY_DN1884_c0_g1_i5.p1 TRINITY_DN1884_c0_g1~~TRINITY_DN1884_c0_g1_i5.p1  ORF type:complete len:111 (+),score=15.94 TRINITY_DN1884_c0_g1_i5:251-583(+)
MDRFPQGGEEHNNMYQLFYEDVIAYTSCVCRSITTTQLNYSTPTTLQPPPLTPSSSQPTYQHTLLAHTTEQPKNTTTAPDVRKLNTISKKTHQNMPSFCLLYTSPSPRDS